MTGDLRLLSMMNMLNNYHPHLQTYDALWAKYGPKPTVIVADLLHKPEPIERISSQEDAIKWSLKLREMMNVIGQETQQEARTLLAAFIEGIQEAGQGVNKLKAGLAKVGDPDTLIERFKLFFTFNGLDDLFLNDENDGNGVMIIE